MNYNHVLIIIIIIFIFIFYYNYYYYLLLLLLLLYFFLSALGCKRPWTKKYDKIQFIKLKKVYR